MDSLSLVKHSKQRNVATVDSKHRNAATKMVYLHKIKQAYIFVKHIGTEDFTRTKYKNDKAQLLNSKKNVSCWFLPNRGI